MKFYNICESKSVVLAFRGTLSLGYVVCNNWRELWQSRSLFQAIDGKFIRDSIYWLNVIAVGLDNTATNMGCNNSIKTHVLAKIPDIFVAGCNCHLTHLAASEGADAFSAGTGFDVEDHEVDVYYYFSKSTKRKLEFLDFVDLEWAEIIRYVAKYTLVIIRKVL